MSVSIEDQLAAVDKLLREIDLAGARAWLGIPPYEPRNKAKRGNGAR